MEGEGKIGVELMSGLYEGDSLEATAREESTSQFSIGVEEVRLKERQRLGWDHFFYRLGLISAQTIRV